MLFLLGYCSAPHSECLVFLNSYIVIRTPRVCQCEKSPKAKKDSFFPAASGIDLSDLVGVIVARLGAKCQVAALYTQLCKMEALSGSAVAACFIER